MSQPANDNFSQHLSDDEASFHEDASENAHRDGQHYLEYIDMIVGSACWFSDDGFYSLFAKQSEDLDLLHEDLEQIDDVDIEEMDINWQIAMIAIRMKKFYKKTGRRVRIDGNKPGTNDGKKRDSFYQDQGAGKKEQNQNCLLTMDDGVVNWGEHTVEEEETNHALMAISSNNEANEIYAKDEKLKKYRRIGMKAVKEKEQLQKTVDSWKNSSKNLWKLVDSVPIPLTRDYTPKPQEEIDDSLYVYGKKGPQKPETSVSYDKFSENLVTSIKEVMSKPKPKEAEPSCVTHVKTPRDCDFYEKKMAREAGLKNQRVFNTGNGVPKPVWNNANRVNRANHFVPRPVQLNAVRSNVNNRLGYAEFCGNKGIKQSIASQNLYSRMEVAGKKTDLIETARTMLADYF
ncbi:hypothetical protein Tco_1156839 [Tanacetum coccineum]